jgi:plastocyanin
MTLLWIAPIALACANCHSADGAGCGPNCTCCGHHDASNEKPNLSLIPPPEEGVVDVVIQDYLFVPQDIEVTPFTTVRWTNLDFDTHDTVSGTFNDAGHVWRSEYLEQGQSFEFTFTDDSLQRFEYFCSLHGGMFGSVTVVAPEPAAIGLFSVLFLSFHPFRRRVASRL